MKIKFGLLEAFVIFVSLVFFSDLLITQYMEIEHKKKSYQNIFEQMGSAINSEVVRFTLPPQRMIEIAEEFYRQKKLDFSDYKLTNGFFKPFMRAHPHITSVNMGDGEGNGYLILRTGEIWRNRIKKATEKKSVRWLYWNDSDTLIKDERLQDDYDPRKRRWYKIAKDNSYINWSNPYIFRTTRDIGITASRNISDIKGKPVVIGIDIMLKDLSAYINKISRIYKNVNIKIVTENGEIIASSEEGFADFLKKGDASLLLVTKDRDELLYNAFTYFKEHKKTLFEVKAFGGTHYVYAKPLELNVLNKFLVFISVSEFYFLIDFKERMNKRFIVFTFLIVLLSFIFAIRFLLPLKKIGRLIKAFSDGEVKKLPFADRKDEIGTLATEFNKMAADLEEKRQKLTDSEKWYRLLFESNPLPFLIVDESSRVILAANDSAVKFYGFSKDEFCKMSLDYIEKKNNSDFVIKTQFVEKTIKRHKKADGAEVTVEVHSMPVLWNNKKAILVLSVDITDRITLEEKLQHAKKMESIGTLAGGIAHDFNNILTAIIGYATLLEMKLKESPLLKEVKDIVRASERAAKLVAQLLAFGRKQMLFLGDYDLREVIQEQLSMLEIIAGKEIKIELLLSDMPLPVTVDKNQIGQVLINLTTNAKDAMPNGGRITIATNRILVTREQVPDLNEGEYAILTFTDTGTGMDEETAKHIFDPFYTTKEVGKGTGLGLSVVYGIIKQHKGDIKVSTALNKGTSFYIYLPLRRSESK